MTRENPSHATFEPSPSATERVVTLQRDGQVYRFAYRVGKEHELLNQLATIVDDPSNPLTWFDAAILSHKVGQSLAERMTPSPAVAKPAA